MRILFTIAAALLALASLGFAQSSAPAAPPPDGRVSNSHIHLFTKDPEVQRHFWVDVMGATAGKMGPDRDMYTLPKVLVIVDKGSPDGRHRGIDRQSRGIQGSRYEGHPRQGGGPAFHHSGRRIQTERIRLRRSFSVPTTSASSCWPDTNLTTVSENHQVHFFTPDIDAMQKWYVTNFGAAPQAFGKVKLANLPGVTLIFSPTETPVTGTKGRALDHIGFEVKDLEGFTKTLEANGVKLDTPYRKIPQMGFAVAFLTDPWGTRIELTERSAASPSRKQKPAQQ